MSFFRRAVLLLVALPGFARGQADPPEISLDDLRLDAPPALALLGKSASSVARPNNPRALIASLVSATGSSGIVPNGYAMETAPYWLAPHPSLTLREYYRASLSDRLRYFTAISAATSRGSSHNDSVNPDARVSIALRTLLLNGRPSRVLAATMDSMRKAQLDYITKFRRAETARVTASGLERNRNRLAEEDEKLSTLVTRASLGPDRELRDSALRMLGRRDSLRAVVRVAESADKEVARLEKQMDDIEAGLATLARNFAARDLEPDGLVLEIAAGTRALFTQGEWGRERTDGFGVWLTPMYRLSSSSIEIIGVARYLARVAEYDDEDLVDLGGRLGADVGRGNLSAEVVSRSVRGSSIRNRSSWSASFNYPLPARLQLAASFGSDFRRPDGRRPVIATLGINLGLGAIMIVPSNATGR